AGTSGPSTVGAMFFVKRYRLMENPEIADTCTCFACGRTKGHGGSVWRTWTGLVPIEQGKKSDLSTAVDRPVCRRCIFLIGSRLDICTEAGLDAIREVTCLTLRFLSRCSLVSFPALRPWAFLRK